MAEHVSKLREWLTSTDHRQIGVMYIVTAWIAFAVGGLMALLVRLELMTAEGNTFVYDQTYIELFTVHAFTMIFLFVMPMSAGFGNYIVPIQIGAKDMAYPRLNAFSFWLIPPAIVLVWVGFIFKWLDLFSDVRPLPTGWTGYVPLSDTPFAGGFGPDLWLIALTMLGMGSTLGAVNFVVTIFKLRKPGMTMHHIPLFCWAMLVTAFLILFATPALTVAGVLLLLDRNVGTVFFDVAAGGSVLTWQHLFWFFGHPEVYILILPAMGIINEVLPRFTRKPIFGYHAMAWSMVGIGFLGFAVWMHHMFTTGVDPRIRATFMAMTMAIGIPTGIKIFNWLATLWRGVLDFKAPLLFSVGFISMFVIGGINGVFTASIPVDYALHDTYWVVSHIHYVLFGGAAMGLYAGTYYWWPVITGKMYSETLAKWHFWISMIGLNVVFFTMHIVGLEGMPRGAATYHESLEGLNQLASVGSFMLGISGLIFFYNMIWSLTKGPRAPHNPWGADATVLEFQVPYPAHAPRYTPEIVRKPVAAKPVATEPNKPAPVPATSE